MNDAFNAEELVGFIDYLSQRPLSSKTIVFFREFGNVHAVQGALAEIQKFKLSNVNTAKLKKNKPIPKTSCFCSIACYCVQAIVDWVP